MYYACPKTGLCISPGRSDWLKISSSNPDFMKAARGAAKIYAFGIPFIALRIRDGRLDPELAEREWNNHVGDDHYADVTVF